MATLISTSFSAFQLTDHEVLEGSTYTYLQKCVLQNHLATEAENRINLTFDPLNPQSFMQEDAYIRGKMDIIKFLLESSAVSEESLANSTSN